MSKEREEGWYWTQMFEGNELKPLKWNGKCWELTPKQVMYQDHFFYISDRITEPKQ